ncbi:MAG: hypothetical protein J6T14_07730, partial [Clostridia bacterium]|nr:hypothetical protein [Clostridia bacterium]
MPEMYAPGCNLWHLLTQTRNFSPGMPKKQPNTPILGNGFAIFRGKMGPLAKECKPYPLFWEIG